MSIDWNLRESARAKMRVTVRRLLKKYGYPPDLQKEAVETLIHQAELMAQLQFDLKILNLTKVEIYNKKSYRREESLI